MESDALAQPSYDREVHFLTHHGEESGESEESSGEGTPLLMTSESGSQDGEFSFTQVMVLCCLCISSFVVNSVSSLASPFYPSDASKFGVSETAIGIILGLYSLTVFVVAPMVPYLITKLSVETTFKIGIILSGVSATVFGFINRCELVEVFVSVSILLRLVQGCGCAFVDTSLYAIIADRYPKNLGKVNGLITLSVGLGFMVGPPLGGFLYAAGGFFLPFVVMGSLTLVMAVFIIAVMPPDPTAVQTRARLYSLYAYVDSDGLEESVITGYTDSGEGPTSWYTAAQDIPLKHAVQLEDTVSLLEIISDVKCLTILGTSIIGSAILGFQEPNLGLFLEQNGYQSAAVGGFFLLRDFLFAVGSIIAGYLVDSIGPYSVMTSGMILGGVGYLALGPIPPFSVNLASILMGLFITGFAGSIPWVSGIPSLLKATRHLGNRKSLNAQISGLQNSCLYFGIFVGSILGGVFLEHCSFRHTYLYFSVLPAGTGVIFAIVMFFTRSLLNFEDSMKA